MIYTPIVGRAYVLVGGTGVDVTVGEAIGDACGDGVTVAVGIGDG